MVNETEQVKFVEYTVIQTHALRNLFHSHRGPLKVVSRSVWTVFSRELEHLGKFILDHMYIAVQGSA